MHSFLQQSCPLTWFPKCLLECKSYQGPDWTMFVFSGCSGAVATAAAHQYSIVSIFIQSATNFNINILMSGVAIRLL